MKYILPDNIDKNNIPKHVAIIMDGNGRWAQKRNMPRLYGHGMGYRAIKPIVEACVDIGIKYISLYAFSSENWSRPSAEVSGIMKLLKVAVKQRMNELKETGVKFVASGRINEIPSDYKEAVDEIIDYTKDCEKLVLNLCFNYGGRNEITDAFKSCMKKVISGEINIEDIDDKIISSCMYHPEIPDPDLVIRTGGEIRISNFLLWEVAYSEIYVTNTFWPDFKQDDLLDAIMYYQNKDRRFGNIKL